MASKVLVPTAPFAKLQLKKSPPDPSGSGFIIGGGDAVARVAHLEHSVRFLQEQHRQMLSGLHSEIEALRERNRDLQFQLIFNKESSPKPSTPPVQEESGESEVQEANLKREVSRLEREAAAARSEARAAEARALQLQRQLDAQAEKLREIESQQCSACGCTQADAAAAAAAEARSAALSPGAAETRAELRARLAEAERLVRRLRADAERQRRELQCMKNSLHASLRASGLDAPYGYQNNYHFPPVHTPEFWREPLREDFNMVGSRGRSTRRPLTLPELSGQQIHRSTVYANSKPPYHYPTLIHHWTYRDVGIRTPVRRHIPVPEPSILNCFKYHTRPRANGYENKNKRAQASNGEAENKSPEEHTVSEAHRLKCTKEFAKPIMDPYATYPELKVVVTKLIPQEKAGATSPQAENRRARRQHHRKHATDHT